jgi:hypothetical protein
MIANGPGRVRMSAEVAIGTWTPVFMPAARRIERHRASGRPYGALSH